VFKVISVILLELQQHLKIIIIAFQQRIVDELIEQWRIQTPCCVCALWTLAV